MSKNETNVLKLWPLFVKLLGKVKSVYLVSDIQINKCNLVVIASRNSEKGLLGLLKTLEFLVLFE